MDRVVVEIDQFRKIEILLPPKLTPGKALFIFAHGSGNNMDAPFMTAISEAAQSDQVNIVRFNFPYAYSGKKSPNSAEILLNAWRMAISWCKRNLEYSHLFIGGKSMGGRIATMIANEVTELKGLIFLGYPLHSPGKYDQLRDEYFSESNAPMLFIQGTRDPFARMDVLQDVLSNFRERSTLHWIEGGDHSFKVLVRQGTSYPETLEKAGKLLNAWILKTIADS